jgi:hypothetical protein
VPAATLLRVESRELPASATRLDTVLRIRSPQGQDYLHIVAWQGDPDRTVRWRLAGYRVWFGQQEPDTPVVGTVVYLRPEADMGDRITQTIDGQVVQPWSVGRIALWEQDAAAALASNRLGLVILSSLMHNADVALVETAARLVLEQAPLPQQGDLLSILGVFAEPLLEPRRFVDLIGRERLMSSDLFDELMKDREAELRAELRSEYEAQLRQQEIQLRRQELQQILEDTLLVQFPDIPFAMVRNVRGIEQPAVLSHLIVAVQQVPDLAAAEQLLREAAEQAPGE